ncbi:MAG: hypothetical protein K0S67_1113 [Nitrososphaeraceae archaeon]|nr:hypothetical protein [Nitrososphaeraceae archaeon]
MIKNLINTCISVIFSMALYGIYGSHTTESCPRFMIESGWAAFNAIKIVPLGRYQNVIEACKKLGTS